MNVDELGFDNSDLDGIKDRQKQHGDNHNAIMQKGSNMLSDNLKKVAQELGLDLSTKNKEGQENNRNTIEMEDMEK